MGAGRGKTRRASLRLRIGALTGQTPVRCESEFAASPATMLKVLTRIDDIRSWFPLPFDVIGEHDGELRVGKVLCARGRLAGKTVNASWELLESSKKHVHVRLSGPITFGVDIHLKPHGRDGCVATADVYCSGNGVGGHILATAAHAI